MFRLNRRLLYLLSIIFCIARVHAEAQTRVQYGFDNYNGLPSAKVYCILADRKGYLYISTDKGVVRYNGYSFHSFDMVDPDIWKLYEDKKGRVWVFRTAEELGYIKNGEYMTVHFKFPFSIKYPRHVVEYDEGLAFLQFEDNKLYFCLEKNDTVYAYNTGVITVEGNVGFLSSDMRVFRIDERGIYEILFKNNRPILKRNRSGDAAARSILVNNLLFLNSPGLLHTLSLRNAKESKVPLAEGERLVNAYERGEDAVVITNKKEYTLSETHIVQEPLDRYLTQAQIDEHRIVYVYQDSFWHNWFATASSGVLVTQPAPPYKKVGDELTGLKYLGKDVYDNLYWFNGNTREFSVMDTGNYIRRFFDKRITAAVKIIPYRGDEMIIIDRSGYYTYHLKTGFVKNLFNLPGPFRYNAPDHPYSNDSGRNVKGTEKYFMFGTDGVYVGNTLFSITGNATYLSFEHKGDTLLETLRHYTYAKWKGIVYDSVLKAMLLYSGSDILLETNGRIGKIKGLIKKAGGKKIEYLAVDQRFGNVFVYDYDRLLLYNYHTGRTAGILSEYKLNNALVHLADSILVVGSPAGVWIFKIQGLSKLSSPRYYPNVKNALYRELHYLSVRKNDVIINTDKGLFAVAIPPFENGTMPFVPDAKYKLIIRYDDSERVVGAGDTLLIRGKSDGVLFDLIRPQGVGVPVFKTSISGDEGWQALNANEFSVAGLDVDRYYRLKLRIEDDVWKSPVTNVVLYIQPAWWQTKTANRLIWLAAIVGLGGIIALAVYYTRKVTLKAQLRKNYLLSLELKSIYAQINPHFIFNTLNTGLYFISENKNEEAYTHISSFSSLLRSYIKSSRNKYVTLAEELENLEYYIRLQQNRFEDRFAYKIAVAPDINAEDFMFPALLLQPFVENAIQHGLLHKKSLGNLMVRVARGVGQREIVCTVEDDGVGREASKKIYKAAQSKPTSYGNELIGDLIKIINTDNKLKVDINVTDKQMPDTGTIVTITVKQIA